MKVAVSLDITKTIHHDDWIGDVTGATDCSITFAVWANGQRYQSLCAPETVCGFPGAVAKIGNVLLTAERYAEIKAAVAELKSHSDYAAQAATISNANQIAAEFADAAQRLDAVMTGNGRTF